MEANIINVGNSKGVIIPAKILKLLGIKDKIHIAVKGNKIIIEPINPHPRTDWAEQFKNADSLAVEELLIPDVFDDEAFDDWEW